MLLSSIIDRFQGLLEKGKRKYPTPVLFRQGRGDTPTQFPLEAVKGKSYIGDVDGKKVRGIIANAIDRDGHIEAKDTEGKIVFIVTPGFGSWDMTGEDLKVYVNYWGGWTILDVRSSL